MKGVARAGPWRANERYRRRLSALTIGTIAVEMTFNGLGSWQRTTTPKWK